MKTRTITTSALAALLIPVAAWAQSSQSPATDQRGQIDQRNPVGQSGSRNPTGSQFGVTTTATSSSQDVKRVSEQDFERKLTADKLVGKMVKDRQGNEVGKIKAVGLDNALNGNGGASDYASTPTQAGRRDASSPTRPAGASGVGSSVNAGGADDRSTRSAGTGLSDVGLGNGEVHVFIEVKDGNSIVSIPASQLSFSQDDEEVTLDRSADEIMRVARQSSALTG